MSTYLVVANQTLGGEHLMQEVRRRAAKGPSFFFVVVPNSRPADAPPPGAPVSRAAASLSAEEEEHRATLLAESRLRQALTQFRAEGFDARGELGDAEPLTAIGDAVALDHSTSSSSPHCRPTSRAGWVWIFPIARSGNSSYQ